MRKLVAIAALLGLGVFCFILVSTGKPIDEVATSGGVAQSHPGSTETSIRSTSTLSDKKGQSGINALPIPAFLEPGLVTGHEFGLDSLGHADHLFPTDSVKEAAGAGEVSAVLRELADHNREQLYVVVLQSLEGGQGEDSGIRRLLLESIRNLGESTPVEILAEAVSAASTPTLRRDALRLITEASQELSLALLNEALGDPDPAVRGSASSYLGDLELHELFVAVADALSDSDYAVRTSAFSTLEEMHHFAPIWEVAERYVDDPHPQIRMRAMELLTYGDHQTAIDLLLLALSDPDPRVCSLAEDLLAGLQEDPS